MGGRDAVSEKSDAVANGSAETESTAEAVLDKTVEHHDGVKEIEVDKRHHHDGLKEMQEDEHHDGEKVDRHRDGLKEIEDKHNDGETEVGKHYHGFEPMYDKLRYAICEILKEVDFNTGAETKDMPSQSEEEDANEEEGADGVPEMSEQAASQSKSTNKSSAKESSRKKKDDLDRKKILKVKGKLKEDGLKPTVDKLRDAICEILKEVDFNTTTFNGIMKLLNKRFNTDLNPRKSDADDKKPSSQGVEA